MDDWNITRNQGKEIIIQVFSHILSQRMNVNAHELCIRMSSEANYNKIFIYRCGKRRNLNNFMKVEFNGLQSFLKNNANIFEIVDNKIRLK